MATSPDINEDTTYSSLTGFIFLFNLIVGAGALTIPHAFAQTGVFYGIFTITTIAFISFISATFMVEAISGVNALLLEKRVKTPCITIEPGDTQQVHSLEEEIDSPKEFAPLLLRDDKEYEEKTPQVSAHLFTIKKKVELAEMAKELFGKNGIMTVYMCIAVYLYGDLAIYAAAVPKSLRDLTCPKGNNNTCLGSFSNFFIYRCYVILFGLVLGGISFGNVQKTKLIQMFTTIIRHLSFFIMVLFVFIDISKGKGRDPQEVIDYEKPLEIKTLFGVCIYAFMCHHSIPSLITPIKNKNAVLTILATTFCVVLFVYLLLCLSACFRFHPNDIEDVYTLNFKNVPIHFFAYFLGLFPVFSLSANFPVIAITLRENLRTLLKKEDEDKANSSSRKIQDSHSRYIYSALAVIPPILVAFFTDNVSGLVGFTGSYAGLGIQWIIPACLVYRLRCLSIENNETSLDFKTGYANKSNIHLSPFSSLLWSYFVLGFSGISMMLVTVGLFF